MIRRPPRSPLFPSTPLSRPPTPVPRHRSHCEADRDCQQDGERPDAERDTSAVDEPRPDVAPEPIRAQRMDRAARSEEHTSELQSQSNLVCRLLLEKKNSAPDDVSSSPTLWSSEVTERLTLFTPLTNSRRSSASPSLPLPVRFRASQRASTRSLI